LWNDALRYLTDEEVKKLCFGLYDKVTNQEFQGISGEAKRFVIGEKRICAGAATSNPFGVSRYLNQHRKFDLEN
jgi:hypothetical protein